MMTGDQDDIKQTLLGNNIEEREGVSTIYMKNTLSMLVIELYIFDDSKSLEDLEIYQNESKSILDINKI
jgi:hypothetical protein